MILWKRRKRQCLIGELKASLTRIRDRAESGARALQVCGARLGVLDEQLEAAVAINDETTARELMEKIIPLLAEHKNLIAVEREFDAKLTRLLSELEKARNNE